MTEQIFHKYPKIFALGHEENAEIFNNPDDLIWVEEKIDGTNIRIFIHDGKITFGSHKRELDENPEKFFIRILEYINYKLKGKDLSKYNNYILYGEGCIKHTINYDWDKIPPFLGFDILDCNTNRFLKPKDASLIFESLGFTFVPILNLELNILTAKTASFFLSELNDEKLPQSKYYLGSVEGLVFKNYNKEIDIFAKYVSTKFKEKNEDAFGVSKKKARTRDENNNNELFISTYATNARIDKGIFALIEDGNILDMKLMHKLPKYIMDDIWEENWKELINSNYIFDFKDLRQKISKRCLNVLKNIIDINKINEKGFTQ